MKYIYILLIALVAIFLSFKVYNSYLFSRFNSDNYSMEKLSKHFEENEDDYYELKNFINSITPKDKKIAFGLEKEANRFYINIIPYNRSTNERIYPSIKKSNLILGSTETDALLSILDWDNKTIIDLTDRINKVKSINIMSGNPVKISHKFEGFGLYSYLIFNESLTDSLKTYYTEKEGDTIYNDDVILRYRSSL